MCNYNKCTTNVICFDYKLLYSYSYLLRKCSFSLKESDTIDRYNIGLVSVIGTYLSNYHFIGLSVKSLIGILLIS